MRASGLLLPISSLPGGRLGKEAFRFVDFCARAAQRWWQLLPVGLPGPGRSPYSALSAFAGNEAWIDAEEGAEDGAPDEEFSRRARLNRPGTRRGNWRWRLAQGQLRAPLARKLRQITEMAGR